MKVYILTDLEGVSGVNGRPDSVGNQIINREASNRLLTEEVNATAEGLLAGGATEIVCWDGHGGSNSISIEQLHPEVQLYQSGGIMNPIMPLADGTAALVQIGAHAMNGTTDGFLNHTFNSHGVVAMRLNGAPIGEIGVCSLCAAAHGVPVPLVAGDRAACREARAFLGQVETVETKYAYTRYSAVNRHPLKVRAELTAAARRVLEHLTDFPVKRVPGPYELTVELMCPNMADRCAMQGADRIDAVTVAYRADDFIDLWSQRNGWAAGVHHARYGAPNPG